MEKIVTSLVVDDGVVLVCGCSCLGDGARSIMTTRKTFNSVLVSLASFSKKTFRDICTHPKLKLNSFVFRPHYFYQFRHKKRFELEREKDRERTNRTSFRSIPPALTSDLSCALPLLSLLFDFGEEKQTFYINKPRERERENWNKKREKTSKGGKRTRDGKGAF